MGRFWERLAYVAAGRRREPENAFDWIRGSVGSRENPDGMRSLLHAGIALALLCVVIDLAVLWRHAWSAWPLFAFLHTAWVAAILISTVLNVGFLETLDGRRRPGLGGPNVLTLLRGFALPVLVYVLAHRDYGLGVFLYGAITLTDAVDGWWARRYDLRTKLGVVLDPIMDAFLHLSVFVTLGLVGLLSPVALILILSRSGLVLLGSGLLYLWKGQVRIQPTPFGKGTGLLLAAATFLLLGLRGLFPGWAPEVVEATRTLVTILLGLSVLHAVAIGAINLARRG
ncbi:MAG: hypothetical protein GF330_07940 [Candidatus Eisenbacteria bacterium]|nr:hypothetical protein [Candidatus Eisenbacteria bacterium]